MINVSEKTFNEAIGGLHTKIDGVAADFGAELRAIRQEFKDYRESTNWKINMAYTLLLIVITGVVHSAIAYFA